MYFLKAAASLNYGLFTDILICKLQQSVPPKDFYLDLPKSRAANGGNIRECSVNREKSVFTFSSFYVMDVNDQRQLIFTAVSFSNWAWGRCLSLRRIKNGCNSDVEQNFSHFCNTVQNSPFTETHKNSLSTYSI